MILHFLPVIVLCREVVHQFDASAADIDYRVVKSITNASPYFYLNCLQIRMLGGYGIFNMANPQMRNFELPPHYKIYIDLTYYRYSCICNFIINFWDQDDQFLIYVDNDQIYDNEYSSEAGSDECGELYSFEIIKLSLQAQHDSNVAVVYMQALNGQSNNEVYYMYIYESWGIRQFTLCIEPCPEGCEYCESNSYLYCK